MEYLMHVALWQEGLVALITANQYIILTKLMQMVMALVMRVKLQQRQQ
jgi:hypothetical protein